MKKISALLALFVCIVTAAQAQVIEGYNNDTLVTCYTNGGGNNYKVVTRKEVNPTPDPAEHEMVDLGLPSGLLWATCNVGADTPYDDGDYFAWGETEPKSDYSWETYKWCKGSYDTMTKYCNDSSYGYNGFTDGKTVLDAEDDAATANWGTGYRMPTQAEFYELNDNCTWTWDSAHSGYTITGTNGNSIFLPTSGNREGSSLCYHGSCGYYWSATLYSDYAYCASFLFFYSDDHLPSDRDGRCLGCTVRAVSAPKEARVARH